MKINRASGLFLTFLALASTANTLAAEKDLISKTFDAKPGGNLEMHVDRGSIKILATDSDQVDIKVTRELKRGSDEEARAAYEEHKIEMSQDGDTVLIRAEPPGFLKGLKNGHRNLSVEYTISVPSKFNLDLNTSGGNIDVATLEGSVELHTSGGNISTAEINGPVEAHTAGGNIQVKAAKTTANLHTSGGNITVGNVQGDLVAKTAGGNITTSDIAGSTDVSTSGGHITVKSARTALKARTTGGNIKAEIASLTETSSLKSTGGNIDLILADKTSANLTAKTTGGQVRSDIEGDLNKQRTKLTAQLNGGGPELTLETTGGNVKISQKK
ncbi:MAG TPA: DUF4097 family beta strand repeat-containing protein [Verrucomicrobiae bacterium]